MVYVGDLGIYVKKVEDLRDRVSEDIYGCVEYLVEAKDDEGDNLLDQYEALQQEFKSYEASLEEYRSCMWDTLSELKALRENQEKLLKYIRDTKRLNRDTLTDMTKALDNTRQIDNIYNTL